jgi:hypothetical protein
MRGNITNTVLAVVHKAITGPKSNHRTLQKQLDWKDWLAAEFIQLDNYAKQNMFGTLVFRKIICQVLISCPSVNMEELAFLSSIYDPLKHICIAPVHFCFMVSLLYPVSC